MSRLANYIGKQIGRFDYDMFFLASDISDDRTSMAEIVKRFTLGQEIPNDQTEKNYQYINPDKVDKNGQPLLDSNGNIVSEEVLTDEVLKLIPLTPNLDDVCLGDMDSIGDMYVSATDKARAYVRGKLLAESKSKVASDMAQLQKLQNTYKAQTVVEAPQIDSGASS